MIRTVNLLERVGLLHKKKLNADDRAIMEDYFEDDTLTNPEIADELGYPENIVRAAKARYGRRLKLEEKTRGSNLETALDELIRYETILEKIRGRLVKDDEYDDPTYRLISKFLDIITNPEVIKMYKSKREELTKSDKTQDIDKDKAIDQMIENISAYPEAYRTIQNVYTYLGNAPEGEQEIIIKVFTSKEDIEKFLNGVGIEHTNQDVDKLLKLIQGDQGEKTEVNKGEVEGGEIQDNH